MVPSHPDLKTEDSLQAQAVICKKLTFITVLFDNPLELRLLQLQAISFILVDPQIIDKILVVFEGDNSQLLTERLTSDLIRSYPKHIRERVSILLASDLVSKNAKHSKNHGWWNQQALKLLAASRAKTPYSIVLDAKNHFVKPITYDCFFSENKPIYFLERHAEPMLKFWHNCIDFFDISDPFPDSDFKIQTVTPYIFYTPSVASLISYIGKKAGSDVYTAFSTLSSITEFFSYFCYLHSKSCRQEEGTMNESIPYNISPSPLVSTIGRADPREHPWNSFEQRMLLVTTYDTVRTFSVHRGSIEYLDQHYRDSLVDFYADTYSAPIAEFILEFILKGSQGAALAD
jgi:hypothetical protein